MSNLYIIEVTDHLIKRIEEFVYKQVLVKFGLANYERIVNCS